MGNGVLALGLAVLAALGIGHGSRPTSSRTIATPSAVRHGDRLFAVALVIPVTAFAGHAAGQEHALGRAAGGPGAGDAGLSRARCDPGDRRGRVVAAARLSGPGREWSPGSTWCRCVRAAGCSIRSAGPPYCRRCWPRSARCSWCPASARRWGTCSPRTSPLDSRLTAVAAYCVGMALFTVLMGNAFAAFPVMTAAVGLPVVVQRFGGAPAVVCAIGMLSGFCGTLMTPMAANFNIVPANLLELPDRNAPFNAVIRTQAPTALPLLLVNVLLMWWLAFR